MIMRRVGRRANTPQRKPAWRIRVSVLALFGSALVAAPFVGSTPDASATPLPATVEAWIYPGSAGQPTCDVPADLSALASDPIALLKPQYLTVRGNGKLTIDTAAELPCNGFSPANLAEVRTAAHQVYVTVSAGSHADQVPSREHLEGVGGAYGHRVVRRLEWAKRRRPRLRTECLEHGDVVRVYGICRRPGRRVEPRGARRRSRSRALHHDSMGRRALRKRRLSRCAPGRHGLRPRVRRRRARRSLRTPGSNKWWPTPRARSQLPISPSVFPPTGIRRRPAAGLSTHVERRLPHHAEPSPASRPPRRPWQACATRAPERSVGSRTGCPTTTSMPPR